ncbi:uncharacterized protein PHACADRAFT_263931 [Phanerochaete carnosa HHB-10118-sp]|uniref:Uncharacterized protein n=1 Tax=Phanerochaete carnosa (strain HHB-10118-sp) TaxID=650164 RepID=K5VUT7_PHACS|nr:uncharacterized protein PHACADRAFT_263931 [Phanerochaete carnosa HHB-10118-sp]EKM50580.1 hypothetical protein PHACADRAFT_263931 [Phanerochaete carnosa HHB-10118-sp]
MLSSLFFVTVLAAVAVRADPSPSEPGPGAVYNEGSTCHISWGPDTSGTWNTMNIELMCGDNDDMIYMTTVATVDGTDATKTSFDYPCPQVTPNSAIYFYQFTSPNTSDVTWTTRFAIADASGNTTPPANSTQPNGDSISWGIGTLVDPSTAVPEPSSGTGNSNGTTVTAPPSGPATSGTPTAASESSGAATTLTLAPAASSPSTAGSNSVLALGGSSGSLTKSSMVTVTTGSAAPTNSATAKNTTGSSVPNGVAVGVSISSRITQSIATLVVVGAAFAAVL